MAKTTTKGTLAGEEIAVGTELTSQQFFDFTPTESSAEAVAPVAEATPAPVQQATPAPVQQATLTSPTGERKVVDVGSAEASQLLQTGFTLGDKVGGGTRSITSDGLKEQPEIELGQGVAEPTSLEVDSVVGGAKEDVKSFDELLAENQKKLEVPESDLSRQVSDLLGETGKSAEALTGRGEAQLSEEEARGIEAQQTIINDKNVELKRRLAEIDALTASFDEGTVKLEGLNILTSGISGKKGQLAREYRSRKNTLAAEAGIIQSEILALQGKLASSQASANRAVDLKYQDFEADYNAKINQLNLLLPQLQKEEKLYGDAVLLALTQEQNAIAEKKQNEKDILGIKLAAINAGITDENVLAQIGNASSLDEATTLLGANMPQGDGDFQFISGTSRQQGGVFDKTTGTFTPQAGGIAPGVSPGTQIVGNNIAITPTEGFTSTTFEDFIGQKQEAEQMTLANPEEFRQEYEDFVVQEQIDFAKQQLSSEQQLVATLSPAARLVYKNANALDKMTNTEAQKALIELESAGLTPDGLGRKQENKLRAEFVSASKDFVKQRDSISRVRASAEDPSGAGDLALIFNFMKVLDPGSVVRESEFATAKNTGSIPQIIWAQYNKVLEGQRLSPPQRQDFLERAEKLFNEADANQAQLEAEFGRLSENADVNPENVIIDYSTSGLQSTQSQSSLINDLSPEQRAELEAEGLL